MQPIGRRDGCSEGQVQKKITDIYYTGDLQKEEVRKEVGYREAHEKNEHSADSILGQHPSLFRKFSP